MRGVDYTVAFTGCLTRGHLKEMFLFEYDIASETCGKIIIGILV